MTVSHVHEDSRPEIGSAESVSWRKSRCSAAGAGAACIEVVPAEQYPDGSVAVPMPNGTPYILLQAPSDRTVSPQREKPPTESVAPWTRGSLEEPEHSDLVTRPENLNGTGANALGLPGMEVQTHAPSEQDEQPPTSEFVHVLTRESQSPWVPEDTVVGKGKGSGNASSDGETLRPEQLDAMQEYVESELAMVEAAAELGRANAQLETENGFVDGASSSKAPQMREAAQTRLAEAQRGLAAAEARFDEASDKLEGLGLARPADQAELAAVHEYEAARQAAQLLGRPRIVVGTDDKSVAAREAQDLVRAYVADEIRQGFPDDAKELAQMFGQELFTRREGLAGGALEVALHDVTAFFNAEKGRIKDAVQAEIDSQERRFQQEIEASARQLANDIARAERGYSAAHEELKARERAERRPLEARGARQHALSELERRYAQARGQLKQQRETDEKRFEARKADLRRERSSYESQIKQMKSQAPVEVLQRQRDYLDELAKNILREFETEQTTQKPGVVLVTQRDYEEIKQNLGQIVSTLKKLITAPTGHRGYDPLLQATVGRHPLFGAKEHNTKVNNTTELARALKGWVEAKPKRHEEKVLAKEIDEKGRVDKLLNVVMWRINDAINKLPKERRSAIRRELASGYSEFEPERHIGTYVYHGRHSGDEGMRKRLAREPNIFVSALHNPAKYSLREKMMVLHDLFEYFQTDPRHTPKTHGTNIVRPETESEAQSTTAVDSHGYRTRSSVDRGQNPIVQRDGSLKTHPSTRNENDPSTQLARERKIPVWAGQSFTAMRMFVLAKEVGATPVEIGAVAYGIFAFWRLYYDHTTQFAYHTLHEVLDIAQNFGVPYTMDDQTAYLRYISMDSEVKKAKVLASVLGDGRAPRSDTGMDIYHSQSELKKMGNRLDRALKYYREQSDDPAASASLLTLMKETREGLNLGFDSPALVRAAPRSPYSLRDGLTESGSLTLESVGPTSAMAATALSHDPAFTAARAGVMPVRRTHTWVDPVSKVVDAEGNVQFEHDQAGNVVTDRSGNPVPQRYAVHSDFDVRRFEVGGRKYTDVTVKVRADGKSMSDAELAGMWESTLEGVERFYNQPGATLGESGTQLHVTVEQVASGQQVDPKLAQPVTVSRAGSREEMDAHSWFPGASPAQIAHELGHPLGMRDEYKGPEGSGIEHRPNITGSLFGDFRKPIDENLPRTESDPELSFQGLRDRYLRLLDRIIGDVEPLSVVSHDLTHAPQPQESAGGAHLDQAPEHELTPPRFGEAPVGVGFSQARWAKSWGLDFGSHVGSAYDALLTAGGGSLTANGRVVVDEGALQQELGTRIGAAEPSQGDWSAAAAYLGSSVLLLHGDGTMSAYGEGLALVLAESKPEGNEARRWVGLSTSSAGPAVSGLSAAQIEWAASEGKRFAGPGGDFYTVLSAAARENGVAQLDFAPQVLRDRLVNWMGTGLSDEGWATLLETAGISGSQDPAVRGKVVQNVRLGSGESMDVLLPLIADAHFNGGIEVIRADGEAYSRLPADQNASITLVPAGEHADTWFSLGEIRPPLTAGAGTRPADVAGGLGWAEPHVPVTGAEHHVGAKPSEAQQDWAFDHGRRLVEVPDSPHAVFDAILTASGGGITVKGEYVSDPARLGELLSDEVRPAFAQDQGLALVVHTIYAAHTPGGAESVDSGRAQADIIRALREPAFRPELANELAPYFANRLGLGVRTVDPAGVVGRYGGGRPVYVTWTGDENGQRHWAAAPADGSRYALDSPLRAPNRSDPALYLLTHAIQARKDALRGGGTGDVRDDQVLNLLDGAQNSWIAHGPTPKSTLDAPAVDLRQPQKLRDAVGGLVQTVHDAIGGDGAVSHVGLGSGLRVGMAVSLFEGLFPRGIGHEPGTAGAAQADLAGLPADHWVAGSLPELVNGLPKGGAALYLGGDRTAVVVDSGEGRTVVVFGTDGVGGAITGRVDLHTPESTYSGAGLALVVDEGGHPLTADELYERHGQDFGSAVGWSFGAGVKQADPETGALAGVSAPQAEWAQRHGAGFVAAESGLNAKFDAAIKAAGGSLTGRDGVTVTTAPQLRQALGDHVRRLTAAPNTLRDFPSIHAAFVAEGADRVIEEFFGQDPHEANAQAVHQQLEQHIGSGQAADYVARAVADPNHWEQVAHSVALDLIADWSGRGVLEVDAHGQVRLHGDPAEDTIAVGALGSSDTKRPDWFAFRPEQGDAHSFGDVQPHSTSSVTARVPRAESGAGDLYHAVLDASGGAIQIDRETLVNNPTELKEHLTTLLRERPDVLDPATRASIEHETGIGAHEGVDKLIDALADPGNHDGEVVARHLIGSYLNTHLRVVEPDGSEHTYGSGRPITIESAEDHGGQGRWAALTLASPDLESGHGVDHTAAADDERVAQAQWAPESFNLKAPEEAQSEGPWRSSQFCAVVTIGDEKVKACVSVAVLTLDAELAAQLGVATS